MQKTREVQTREGFRAGTNQRIGSGTKKKHRPNVDKPKSTSQPVKGKAKALKQYHIIAYALAKKRAKREKKMFIGRYTEPHGKKEVRRKQKANQNG